MRCICGNYTRDFDVHTFKHPISFRISLQTRRIVPNDGNAVQLDHEGHQRGRAHAGHGMLQQRNMQLQDGQLRVLPRLYGSRVLQK